MSKEIILKKGTIKLIRDILGQPEWATEIIDIYNAGKLIEEVLIIPELNKDKNTSIPVSVFFEELNLQLTSGQINTIRKAFQASAKKGIVLVSPFAVNAIEKLELLPPTKTKLFSEDKD